MMNHANDNDNDRFLSRKVRAYIFVVFIFGVIVGAMLVSS